MSEEEMIYQRESKRYMPNRLTIEGQLQMYERHPEKSERSATLWHAWRQNKGWLTRLLELTVASFPSYSRHNASHAEAVLYNIERILGENRIKELSATDCFAILHTVYVHDIGMAMLASDRENIIKSDEFADMIDNLENSADEDMRYAAQQLKKRCYRKRSEETVDYGGREYYEKQQKLYAEKLDTYYAVIQMLSEYQRRKHGENVATKVKDWIKGKDMLQSEFAMSGIPMRIFFRIADCASLHTDWEFQHVMDLPDEENGYEKDMIHPRFVAVLLQLGDALDIDNDRFHPFAQAFLGRFPMQSQAHYDKHLAIRTLKITPEEVVIEADCESREAMRLVRSECDALEDLLKSASYHWSSIAPRGFSGALPSLKAPRLLLKGKAIPLELTMMRFQISQRKAFTLLQGENIYSGRFPFVRELVQNAIDSTKIQCYRDFKSSSKLRYKKEQEQPSITNISTIINPVEYPIEIEIQCAHQDANNVCSPIQYEDIPEKCDENENYGILFSIRDYGTGIDKETIKSISDVGTSYQGRKRMIREMPDWLRPTGEFGIGLQSVFLVTDQFLCETYVRNGEHYRIEFRNGANGDKGYINVEPLDDLDNPMAYGTEFRVFIGYDKCKPRKEFMEAWPGYDPFEDGYELDTMKHDIVELTSQILLDIDRQLENLLFPVYAYVKFDMEGNYSSKLAEKIHNIVFDNTKDNRRYKESILREYTSWIYKCNSGEGSAYQVCSDENSKADYSGKNIIKYNLTNGTCMVDLTKMDVYLWLEKRAVSAKLGVGRIIGRGNSGEKKLCKVYYKGIWIESMEVKNDAELLEHIDIQGHRSTKSFLQLSRNGFTEEGERYIQETVVPDIFQGLFEALKRLVLEEDKYDNRGSEENPEEDSGNHKNWDFVEAVGNNLERMIKRAVKKNENDLGWKRQLMGISLFYHFYMLERGKERKKYLSTNDRLEDNRWNRTIQKVGKIMEDYRQKLADHGVMDTAGKIKVDELFIDAEKNICQISSRADIAVADFFNRENRFVVISTRRYEGDVWVNYLVMLSKESKPDIIDEIAKETFGANRDRCWQESLEQWAVIVLKNIVGIVKDQSAAQSSFIQWLMKYVPVVGIFADFGGNQRIHVLSGKPLDSIFYNRNAKYLLMKKMAERKTKSNADRFASFVWKGYEALMVNEVQEDVCSITEKYVYANRGYMVLPYMGNTIQELTKLLEKEITPQIINEGKALEKCVEIDMYLFEDDQDFMNLFNQRYAAHLNSVKRPVKAGGFWDKIRLGFDMVLQKRFEVYQPRTDEAKELPPVSDLNELCRKIYTEILNESAYFTVGYFRDEIMENKEMFRLLDELTDYCYIWWRKIEKIQDAVLKEEMQRIKIRDWDENSRRENLSRWTAQMNGNDQEVIQENYEAIWKESEQILTERGGKQIEQHFNYQFIKKITNIGLKKAEKEEIHE
ncbi:hypothetical protein ABXS75_00575 [Roseburia hominis]